MDFFAKAKAVKLRSHHNKYLVADGDQVTVRQSRNGGTKKARWLVETIDGDANVVRLKSFHGLYLTASNAPFLLGMTGKKVLQTRPDKPRDMSVEWRPERDGFQVKILLLPLENILVTLGNHSYVNFEYWSIYWFHFRSLLI